MNKKYLEGQNLGSTVIKLLNTIISTIIEPDNLFIDGKPASTDDLHTMASNSHGAYFY